MVGGMADFSIAFTHIISSTAPLAPSKWPRLLFVELTGILYACSPNTDFIAELSAMSFSSVPVPCALM